MLEYHPLTQSLPTWVDSGCCSKTQRTRVVSVDTHRVTEGDSFNKPCTRSSVAM